NVLGSLLLLRPLRPPSLALNREHLAVCLELRLQDRLREQQRPPHARARAHIHKLVVIWRKQVLTRDERGREHPLTLGVGPHINEPLLLLPPHRGQREGVAAEFLRDVLAGRALGVPKLEAMARTAGLL